MNLSNHLYGSGFVPTAPVGWANVFFAHANSIEPEALRGEDVPPLIWGKYGPFRLFDTNKGLTAFQVASPFSLSGALWACEAF